MPTSQPSPAHLVRAREIAEQIQVRIFGYTNHWMQKTEDFIADAIATALAEVDYAASNDGAIQFHEVLARAEQAEADLVAARAEIAKLTRHVEIIQTALNRYLPCPDHRDKVERGGRCLVCRAESARRDALREAAEELAVFRVEWAQAGAAWLRTKAEETG